MFNEEVKGFIVMEATLEPEKPKILNYGNEPNMFYVTFETCLQSFDVLNRNKTLMNKFIDESNFW